MKIAIPPAIPVRLVRSTFLKPLNARDAANIMVIPVPIPIGIIARLGFTFVQYVVAATMIAMKIASDNSWGAPSRVISNTNARMKTPMIEAIRKLTRLPKNPTPPTGDGTPERDTLFARLCLWAFSPEFL